LTFTEEPTFESQIITIYVARILDTDNRCGFPGCIGSLECMHWAWKNCPTTLADSYKGKETKPTLVLEAVANQCLWIWHCFFGTAGALNSINVLEKSHLFEPKIDSTAWDIQFTVHNWNYKHDHYLVDGIYPAW
jgi:hypothetical protein